MLRSCVFQFNGLLMSYTCQHDVILTVLVLKMELHYCTVLYCSLFGYGKVSKKNQWNFPLRGAVEGRGRISQFSTKKNNCLKHLKRHKKHFKTNLFFPHFQGVGGLFTRTEFLSFDTRPSCNYSPTRIIQNPFHDLQINFSQQNFFPLRGGAGVRPLVEFFTIFFKTFPKGSLQKKTAIIVILSLSHFKPTLSKETGTVISGTKSI